MTYHGGVKNGVVQLDDGVNLSEGTEVKVNVISHTPGGAGGVFPRRTNGSNRSLVRRKVCPQIWCGNTITTSTVGPNIDQAIC